MKRILSFFLTLVLTAALLSPAAAAANETAGKDSDWLYITLDPGHGGDGAGGNDPGAISGTYGYQEADLVLKIGLYLKEELETYRNVHVDMTRSDSYGTSATAPLSKVENRVLYAAGKGSDLLVSLHLNSSASSSAQGATKDEVTKHNIERIHNWGKSYRKYTRSEERRVGKECRSRWSPYH